MPVQNRVSGLNVPGSTCVRGFEGWDVGLQGADSGCRCIRGTRNDFGIRVSGFGFRVSGFGSRNSGFGPRYLGLGSRDSGLGSRFSVFGSRCSGLVFRIPGLVFRASGFGFGSWVSDFGGTQSSSGSSSQFWNHTSGGRPGRCTCSPRIPPVVPRRARI